LLQSQTSEKSKSKEPITLLKKPENTPITKPKKVNEPEQPKTAKKDKPKKEKKEKVEKEKNVQPLLLTPKIEGPEEEKKPELTPEELK
jgi:hypothetical protein